MLPAAERPVHWSARRSYGALDEPSVHQLFANEATRSMKPWPASARLRASSTALPKEVWNVIEDEFELTIDETTQKREGSS